MKKSTVLISAAAGMIIGGITLGGVATASPGPTMTVNQGIGTGTGGAWKVDGSGFTQPVTGTVNVGNFPSSVPVSGTVSAAQSGPWTVTVTPATPYTGACVAQTGPLSSQCTVSPPASPVLVKDVSLEVAVPAGSDLDDCQVFTGYANPANDEQAFIPMIKQGSENANVDGYVGNSQVDIAVSPGGNLGVQCIGTTITQIVATFQGDVTS